MLRLCVFSCALMMGAGACAPRSHIKLPNPPVQGAALQQQKTLSELEEQLEKIETYLPFHGQCEREETFSRSDLISQVEQIEKEFESLTEENSEFRELTKVLGDRPGRAENLVGQIHFVSDEFDVKKPKDVSAVSLEDFNFYSMSWEQLMDAIDLIQTQLEELEKTAGPRQLSLDPEARIELLLHTKANIDSALRLVKRLTFEDYYRVWALSEYTVKHDNIIFLENMIKVLSWHRGKTSPEPFFESFAEASAPFQAHWNASPAFGFLKKWISESEKDEEKMEHMQRFEEKIKETLVHRKGWQSWSVVPQDDDKFDVYLTAAKFAGVEETLERWFMNAWSALPGVNFELHWQEEHETFAVGSALVWPTRLNYLGDIKQLSYVDPQAAEMFLQGDFRVATFAHEMGHVLGLPDEYYTVWDAQKCEYQVWSQSGNLMSNSFGGRVLPSHIQRLKEIYNEPVYN